MDLMKHEHDDEQQAFLPPRTSEEDVSFSSERRPRNATWYLRWTIEILIAMTIALLLGFLLNSRDQGRIIHSPVPTFPRKVYTFLANPRYIHEDMFASEKETLSTLHNWIELSADARGYIHLEDWANYDLGDPYTVQVNHTSQGPAYIMTVFHQLHCLSYIVQQYQSALGGTELTQEITHHSAHCFDYLRQSIICSSNTNLEGKTEAGPGWGSAHECTDYDAVLKWANEHGALKWKKIIPEEAVL